MDQVYKGNKNRLVFAILRVYFTTREYFIGGGELNVGPIDNK